MPKRPSRACWCGQIQPCAKHQRVYDQHRGNARQRGYDTRWEKYRGWFIGQLHCECGRNHTTCEGRCRDEGKVVPAYAVDHIEPHRGDAELFWRHSNHQSLCQSCHNRKSQSERR